MSIVHILIIQLVGCSTEKVDTDVEKQVSTVSSNKTTQQKGNIKIVDTTTIPKSSTS